MNKNKHIFNASCQYINTVIIIIVFSKFDICTETGITRHLQYAPKCIIANGGQQNANGRQPVDFNPKKSFTLLDKLVILPTI